VLPIGGRNLWRRLSREASRVVKLEDWNGATRLHRPPNAVALAWSANAAMHDRTEKYSTPDAATRWRLPFGGRYHARSFGPTSSLRQNQGYFRDSRRLHQTPHAKRGTLYVPVLSDQRPLFEVLITALGAPNVICYPLFAIREARSTAQPQR
jgi:hypothetical protein